MILDAYLRLADTQAFTATAVSANTKDLGGTNKDISGGLESLVIAMSVDVAANAADADETYELQAISSAAADLSSPTVLASRLIPRADLTAGSQHFLDIPQGPIALRYLGARLVLGGTTPSITATLDIIPRSFAARWTTYPGVF